jgi:hypothetical protein
VFLRDPGPHRRGPVQPQWPGFALFIEIPRGGIYIYIIIEGRGDYIFLKSDSKYDFFKGRLWPDPTGGRGT